MYVQQNDRVPVMGLLYTEWNQHLSILGGSMSGSDIGWIVMNGLALVGVGIEVLLSDPLDEVQRRLMKYGLTGIGMLFLAGFMVKYY